MKSGAGGLESRNLFKHLQALLLYFCRERFEEGCDSFCDFSAGSSVQEQ